MASNPNDLTRITLAVLFIVGLIALSFVILRPFAAATVWAVTLVLATWPLMRSLEEYLGGRRVAAVAVMTFALLLLVMVPLTIAISLIARNAQSVIALSDTVANFSVPPPPRWLSDIPLVGGSAAEEWRRLANSSDVEIAAMLRPYGRTVAQWFVEAVGSFGAGAVHILLTIAIAAILYANGESAADWSRRFGRRLAAERGEGAVVLAGQAIRGVALGVVVTALAQTLCTAIALVLTGVPHAGLLAAFTLFLCLAQLGPGLIIVPAVVWLFATEQSASGFILAVIGVPTVVMDNVLRPILIRRGADLPFLLILVGVIGGLLAFGIIGLFIGPVILAVTQALLQHWMAGDEYLQGRAK